MILMNNLSYLRNVIVIIIIKILLLHEFYWMIVFEESNFLNNVKVFHQKLKYFVTEKMKRFNNRGAFQTF